MKELLIGSLVNAAWRCSTHGKEQVLHLQLAMDALFWGDFHSSFWSDGSAEVGYKLL